MKDLALDLRAHVRCPPAVSLFVATPVAVPVPVPALYDAYRFTLYETSTVHCVNAQEAVYGNWLADGQ